MYIPKHFKSDDTKWAKLIMRENPFASVISVDDNGFPFVSHLPVHYQEASEKSEHSEETDFGFLLAHCAKANPHGNFLQKRSQALITFVGAHSYMSPSVYDDLQRVPTWNYVAVHATVETRILENEEAKDSLLKQLIKDHEPVYTKQWNSLSKDWTSKMLRGITALEFKITKLECKLKLNQDDPESFEKMYKQNLASNNQNQKELAIWM